MHLGLQVTGTRFSVVDNLVLDILLGTGFITKNMKSIYPKRGVVVSTGSCPVASETESNATSQANSVECPENRVDTE